MRTLLFTGYDDPYRDLADITVPRMLAYACCHGWDFKVWRTFPFQVSKDAVYWTGACGAIEGLENGYDRVVYLDCDQLVTNMDFDRFPTGAGFHVSRDWGPDATDASFFSMCGFAADKAAEPIFRAAWMLAEIWKNRPFPEQGVMRHVVTKGIHGPYAVHPRRLFNAVPEEVCPDAVQEPWQAGDWCAHLTMMTMPERVALAKKLINP